MAVSATDMPVVRAREACLRSEVLLGRLPIELPCSLAASNLGEFNPAFARQVFEEAFYARRASATEIELCQLRSDTVLHGGGHFLVTMGGAELEEQIPPSLMHEPDRRHDILRTSRPTVEGAIGWASFCPVRRWRSISGPASSVSWCRAGSPAAAVAAA